MNEELKLCIENQFKSGPEVLNFFMLTTEQKNIMLINDKMPTIIGILTFISMINTTSDSLIAQRLFVFQHFSFVSS